MDARWINGGSKAVLQEEPAPEAAALVRGPCGGSVIPEPVSEIPSLVEEPEPVAPSMDELGVRLSQLIGEEVKPQEPEEGPFQEEPVEEEYAGSRTDMPDWLSRVDSASQNEEVTQPITPVRVEKPETEMPELPDWLRGLDEEQKWPAPASLSDELPSWLQGEPDLPAEAEPTVPADWRSMEAEGESQQEVLPVIEPRPEPELPSQGIFEAAPEIGSELPAEYEPEPEPEQIVRRQPTPRASKKAPVRPASERRQAGILAPVSDPELAAARSEMKRGDIPSALEHYERLIKKGRWLEESIRDLRDALDRSPVEVTVWQTLGDAYMRENRLQEALDSYTKAEELLR
jgi:hypothetical protein